MLGGILSSLVEILKEVVVIIVICILIVVIVNSWLDGKEIEATVKCFGKEIVSFSRKWNKKEKSYFSWKCNFRTCDFVFNSGSFV